MQGDCEVEAAEYVTVEIELISQKGNAYWRSPFGNVIYAFLWFWMFSAKSFQIAGWKRIRSGNNSSLPANISNIRIILEKMLKCPKFCVGPTRARPGPILLIVAITAVKFVTKSLPSKEMAKMDREKIIIKVIKKTLIERTTSCSTGFPSILIFFTLFGWI